MTNNTFNPFQFAIRGRLRIGQHQFGVENIQPLVLHGAHVEMAHSNGVELIKVVFQAIHRFVPGHRPFQ